MDNCDWRENVVLTPPSDTLEITRNGEYPVQLYDMVDVNVSGGGSSDFSTCQVTFDGIADTGVTVVMPYADDDANGAYAEAYDETLTAILYKGVCVAWAINGVMSSSDSTVEIDGDTATITGDCTITVSHSYDD